MIERIGFWDYTCPRHGSLETYTADDWDRLLDDMAAGGFNALALSVKWLTTGYFSSLPWLDQDPNCTAIASRNELIEHALRGAAARGIEVWLLVVGTQYHEPSFGIAPANPGARWGDIGLYDLDHPEIQSRILQMYAEIADLFGSMVSGIVVELELCDGDAPHRKPIYNAWAQANNQPDYDAIHEIDLEPRSYPFVCWRNFTTDRRIDMLDKIRDTMVEHGYAGQFATLVELENIPGAVVRNVNIERLRQALPDWELVTYDSVYDRNVNRLATMGFCIDEPKQLGFDVQYLTRGVMTFAAGWGEQVVDLETQWRQSIEDVLAHPPQTLWFMGSDARHDGSVCNLSKLPAFGFNDGRTARLKLMALAQEMNLIEPIKSS